MSTSMEVEGQPLPQKSVMVHPLAIVHMSDQYTRVTCGGSPLGRNAPVIGILFGTSSGSVPDKKSGGTSSTLSIKDADDTIPLDDCSAEKQVELHQAVFPLHTTVGWYRVVGSGDHAAKNAGPTLSDLQQTQRLRQKYPGQDMVFALLQVPNTKSKDNNKKPKAAATTSTAAGAPTGEGTKDAKKSDHDDDDDNDDDELPLTLYQVVGNDGAAGGQGEVLVAIEDWKISTSEAERFAVERVISEKVPTAASGSTADDMGIAAVGGKNKKIDQLSASNAIAAVTEAAKEQSEFYQQTTQVQDSWQAIQDRLDILVTFLESVQEKQKSGAINGMAWQEYFEQQALLRQVQGLLMQLGPLAATSPDNLAAAAAASSSSSTPLQQLSALAKTIDAATSYTDKFRTVQDGPTPSASSLMMGGGGAREFRRGFGL